VQLSAQQSPLFGFTSQILSVTNPSLTKSASPVNITLAGRKYWTGIPDGPEAFLGSFSLSSSTIKSAVGGYIWRENAPLISKQMMGLNYAYAVKNMDEGNNFRMGLGLDFISVNSNNSSVLVDDYNDPFYNALYNNNQNSVDFRVGFALNLQAFELGAALQQVMKSKNTIGSTPNGSLSFDNAFVANGHVKYNIKAGEHILITPLVFMQYQENVPMRVDINVLAERTGIVWGGAWIRPNAAAGVMAGLWILPEVKLGYMYEKTFFKGISSKGNSHELMISYSPSLKKKEVEPKPEIKTVEQPTVIHRVDTIVIVKETRITEEVTKAPEKEVKVTPEPSNSEMKFYVITGLFSLKENADKVAKKLQADGYKSKLVLSKPKNQYYVTVGGKFNTKDEAHAYIKKNPNPNYTFWVKEMAE